MEPKVGFIDISGERGAETRFYRHEWRFMYRKQGFLDRCRISCTNNRHLLCVSRSGSLQAPYYPTKKWRDESQEKLGQLMQLMPCKHPSLASKYFWKWRKALGHSSPIQANYAITLPYSIG